MKLIHNDGIDDDFEEVRRMKILHKFFRWKYLATKGLGTPTLIFWSADFLVFTS